MASASAARERPRRLTSHNCSCSQGEALAPCPQGVLDARALAAPLEPIAKDLNTAIAVLAVYEATFGDACVMDWTQGEAMTDLAARLQVIGRHHRMQDHR